MKKICFAVAIVIFILCSCKNSGTIVKGDIVSIYFKLKTSKGDVFDQSFQLNRNLPLAFIIGNREVISGIDKALLGHNAGDTVVSKIFPEDAYGKQGVYYCYGLQDTIQIIPPNDTLLLEAKILSVKKQN